MLGVCYYPEHWPESWWPEDAKKMREVGISFVRIAEFAWSRIEPEAGRFAWAWLDRAIDTLHKHGLRVVMCTPTATPPKWLIEQFPGIVPLDEQGRARGFGSRRHYTFSSPDWLRESRRICEIVAQRYGAHPGVAGWQTDNEYGCHDTVMSYGRHDLEAFQGWLRQRYQTPQQLNEAWGNVFWSMELTDFAQVTLPNLTVTQANPAAALDFRRFSSEQVTKYDAMQAAIIRKYSPGRWVTHNFMGFFTEFDHFLLGDHLDFASWDSYPLGFVERSGLDEAERTRWAETSHPDIAPFHHDLYRGIAGNKFWVMEQQPGPVNWAPWNPVPKPGMVRIWSWEALAHGAEVVSYFRWRQVPFAQEQMHAGLNRPDRTLSVGGHEAMEVGKELFKLGVLAPSVQSSVALVYSYEAAWMTKLERQGQDFIYSDVAFRYYTALRRMGLNVDIVRPGASLKGYKAVVVPCLPYISPEAMSAFRETQAQILFGPRSGAKTHDFAISPQLPPGDLQALIALKVTQVASLRPGLTAAVAGHDASGREQAGKAWRWREWVETELQPQMTFQDGNGALFTQNNVSYLAFWPQDDLLQEVIRAHVIAAGVQTMDLPEHVRVRRRGKLTFAFNYGPESWNIPDTATLVLGEREIKPQQLSVWE